MQLTSEMFGFSFFTFRPAMLLAATVFFYAQVSAQQVEHNYKVGPQFTDCDSISFNGSSKAEAIEKIRNGKFRMHKNFRLTRKSGFQSGEFYSCNTQTGFLLITYNNTEYLFTEVGKTTWDEIQSSNDPEGYFLKIKGNLTPF